MNSFYKTLIGRADSYKYSHFMQYPAGITNNNSYVEARGIDDKSGLPPTTEVVFFGLQAFLKEYMATPITLADINKAEKMVTSHGEPFNRQGWIDILTKFNGYLPIEIWALPEGTVTNPGNVLVQVRATHPDFYWLTSFVETAILRAVWYPSTVATVSRETKKVIRRYMEVTAEPDVVKAAMPFRLHDFGQRGVSSAESAALGGLAHLVNFMGTDTVEALWAAEDYYNAKGPVGFSIPASEHSTITSWGKENEYKAFENMIDKYGGEGKLFACVSDSFDIMKAVKDGWGKELKEKVLASGATLVVRPDSGDPVKTVLAVIESLATDFGTTTNAKGYKVLHPSVRVIQGDGVNIASIREILEKLMLRGYSAENIAFGMGGALLQKVNRDTLKFAMKTSAVEIDGKWVDVFKEPIGAYFKKSKRGILKAVNVQGTIITVTEDWSIGGNLLQKVWDTGNLLIETDFESVRAIAALSEDTDYTIRPKLMENVKYYNSMSGVSLHMQENERNEMDLWKRDFNGYERADWSIIERKLSPNEIATLEKAGITVDKR